MRCHGSIDMLQMSNISISHISVTERNSLTTTSKNQTHGNLNRHGTVQLDGNTTNRNIDIPSVYLQLKTVRDVATNNDTNMTDVENRPFDICNTSIQSFHHAPLTTKCTRP